MTGTAGTALAVDWGSSVTSAATDVATFVPKLVAFIVVLVVGYLVAKALGTLTDKVLERVGFDRAVERGGVARAMAHSKYDASDIAAKLVYYAVLLFALQLAFGIFGPNPISDIIRSVIAFLPKIFVALVIVVVTAAIASAVKDIIAGSLSGLSYGKVLGNIAYAFILGLGIIAALNQVDVATTVTTPILITVLATIGGILVVGVGGGLIMPMRTRWERWLSQGESEVVDLRQRAGNGSATGRRGEPAPEYAAGPGFAGGPEQPGTGATDATRQMPSTEGPARDR
ncbi:MAG: mechanosensitive ion channel family protein [Motilibacteraceae bacterium]